LPGRTPFPPSGSGFTGGAAFNIGALAIICPGTLTRLAATGFPPANVVPATAVIAPGTEWLT
jgi:hypothetical protein